MPHILSVKDKHPSWGEGCFIAENATIVGDVVIGEKCSVWFNAVIRGDVNYIKIGNSTNIQDNVCIHATYLKSPTNIGDNVSIGHNAIVMDDAVVEPYVIIGAGSVVLERTVCESGYLYAGSPAKKIKPLTDEQRAFLDRLPNNYIMYSSWFTEQ
jgi:carbonic anhydrase/acetyltransferase-like protein (isoleucine patch superfamily)